MNSIFPQCSLNFEGPLSAKYAVTLRQGPRTEVEAEFLLKKVNIQNALPY